MMYKKLDIIYQSGDSSNRPEPTNHTKKHGTWLLHGLMVFHFLAYGGKQIQSEEIQTASGLITLGVSYQFQYSNTSSFTIFFLSLNRNFHSWNRLNELNSFVFYFHSMAPLVYQRGPLGHSPSYIRPCKTRIRLNPKLCKYYLVIRLNMKSV